MGKRKILQSVLFFILGIGLFLLVFRSTDLTELKNQFSEVIWFWVVVSVLLNLISQMVRAFRWKQMFKPLKYTPKIINLFFAVLVLAFTNQIIPRGGEVARLGIVKKYEKIPIPKLLGMAAAERLVDFTILLLIFITLLFWKLDLVKRILSRKEITMDGINLPLILLISAGVVVVTMIILIILKNSAVWERFRDTITTIKADLKDGFLTLKNMDRKPLFIVESILIYGIWLLMLYVLFFSFPPTAGLGFGAAAFTFGLATMAFLLPVQAGMGAWHFLVIQGLLLFGIPENSGKTFSLIAHTATNYIHLMTGLLAYLLLLITNQTYQPTHRKSPVQ